MPSCKYWLSQYSPLASLLLAVFLFLSPSAYAQQQPAGQQTENGEQPIDIAVRLFSDDPAERQHSFERIRESGDKGFMAPVVQWLRFFGTRDIALETLRHLSGEDAGNSWHDWQLWLETHPDITAIPSFDRLKASLLSRIDENFLLFVHAGVKTDIRLEEIVWGGVVKDGIPSLDDPDHIKPEQAAFMTPEELVFGVEINGDARAYPLRIMDWHEMFNDVIGGVPVALAYCTLCGSGILFETQPEAGGERMLFGSSGLLYRSNKLMYDRGTNSLWNQFTGTPVVGALAGSGIELKIRPVVISSWAEWLRRHPDTKILSLETGYQRDYRPGKPYAEYFASPDLMFPAGLHDRRLAAKDHVFVLRRDGTEKAWPLDIFTGTPVVNDRFAGENVVLVGNSAEQTVRAYRRGEKTFHPAGHPTGASADHIEGPGGRWELTEAALIGPDGTELERLGGHVAYWFAYQNFLKDAPLVTSSP